MITEDYVSFETAKLLKEKGFDEYTAMVYNQNGSFIPNGAIEDTYQTFYSAPTLQMVMKWLREVHKIGIFPSTYTFTIGYGTEERHPYGTAIINLVTYELITNDIMPRNSYEQAAEAAIKYCLENLI